jgi:hypothetical protein
LYRGNLQGKSLAIDTSNRTRILTIAAIMLAAAAAQLALGRRIWGVGAMPGFWSGDIWSEHNSQFLFDPYTFTHITHGILFYALLSLVAGTWPVPVRFSAAVALEAAWEVLENTDFVINRYRMETISLNYYGDSVMNSMADIVACMVGFVIAARIPKPATVALTVGLEVLLLVWTRDNLILNIVMLFHPNGAIRAWQMGH